MIDRRTLLAASAALAAPAVLRAQTTPQDYGPALDRARSLGQLHAVVIVEDGVVAEAEAFRGPAIETPANVKSVSKTLVAALLGTAIDAGEIAGVDATIGDIGPALIPAGAAPEVATITVEDLVTMRAGLDRTSGPNYGAWVESRDWVADALARPMVADPGGRFLYSTGSFHILGAVLSEVTGESLLDLARTRLGRPLDIAIPPWTRDPQGRYMGGNNMALSPLAMARFGEAYRLDGAWDGTRIVGADWVAASWTRRVRSPWSGDGYGYGWFLSRADGARVAYARGYGGQMIYVLPDMGLTVAVTSDPNRPARSRGHVGDLNAMLADLIVPAARARRGGGGSRG